MAAKTELEATIALLRQMNKLGPRGFDLSAEQFDQMEVRIRERLSALREETLQ